MAIYGYDSDQSTGKVVCNKNILLSVINGVSKLCNNFGSKIKRMFSRSNYFEGVKVSYGKDSIMVDIYLNVFFGYSVADVAYRVQENIKNGISSMMDININGINVHVLGVDFSKEDLQKNN